MIVKIFAESNCKLTTGITFMFMMVGWLWCRMLAMAWIIYETATVCRQVVDWSNFLIFTFCGLMSVLCLMHHYWFYLFIFILKKFLFFGQTEDTIGGVEKHLDPTNDDAIKFRRANKKMDEHYE